MDATSWLALLLFLVAVLYASVGHAGASGYLAAMALAGLAPAEMRPTALLRNIVVGGIGLVRFHRAGHVRWRQLLPLVAASAPAAFLAARVQLPQDQYALLLGSLLLAAAVLVWRSARDVVAGEPAGSVQAAAPAAAVLAGALIGVLSGLTGTGGAIFLTPLLVLLHWARTRDAAGISVAFVWINSIMALAGLASAGAPLPAALPLWVGAVALGALVGTQLGIHWLPLPALRRLLAVVLVVAAAKLLVG